MIYWVAAIQSSVRRSNRLTAVIKFEAITLIGDLFRDNKLR